MASTSGGMDHVRVRRLGELIDDGKEDRIERNVELAIDEAKQKFEDRRALGEVNIGFREGHEVGGAGDLDTFNVKDRVVARDVGDRGRREGRD